MRPLTPAALLSHPDSSPPLQPSTQPPLSLFTPSAEAFSPASASHFLSELQNWPPSPSPRVKSGRRHSLKLFGVQLTNFFVRHDCLRYLPTTQLWQFQKKKRKNGTRTPGTAEAFSLLEEFIQAPLPQLLTEGLSSAVTRQGDGGLRGWLWDSPSLGWRALHWVRQPRSSPLCSPLQSGDY